MLLAPFTLVLATLLLGGWYAAAPAGAQKPKQEEQEEGDEPAKPATKGKVPKREEVENQLYETQMSVYARRYLRDLKRVANIETAEDRAIKNAKSSSAALR